MKVVWTILWTAMCACIAVPLQALAQTYPSKPIRIIVPFPAGGAADLQTRAFADAFTQAMGQPVVVDNRPGAAGNIGTEAAAKAPPDGYTLVIGGPNVINNAYLYKTVPYVWQKELMPLGLMFSNPNVLIVNNNVPAHNMKDFIDLVKASPDKYAFGSSGAGGSIHLSALLFMQMTGTKMRHIPYRGDALAKTDLLAGEIQLMFNALSSSLENIKAGQWRALGTTGATRAPQLPDVPTIDESGLSGYVVTSWQGLFGPVGLPADVVAKIQQGFDAVFKSETAMKRFAELGTTPAPSTAARHAAFMAEQETIWSAVFKSANLAPQ